MGAPNLTYSQGGMDTRLGGLSLTWERYQRPLWNHKGLTLRTTFWKVEPAKEVRGGLFLISVEVADKLETHIIVREFYIIRDL